MEFNIQSAKDAVAKKNLEIRKWDGLTHALLRAGLGADAQSKDWKDLQKDFNQLDLKSRADILALAQDLSKDSQPFHAPTSGQTNYSVDKNSYTAQKIVYATSGGKSVPSERAPADKPAAPSIAPRNPGKEPAPSTKPELKPAPTPTPAPAPGNKAPDAGVPAPKTPEKQNEILSVLGYPASAVVFRDGAYYLIGKDGKPKAIEYKNFANARNGLPEGVALTDAQKSRMTWADDIAIFLEAYTAEYPKKADSAIKAWKRIDTWVIEGDKAGEKFSIGEITKILGMSGSDAKEWQDASLITNTKSRRLELYKLIKSMGQYDLVVAQIARKRYESITNTAELIASIQQGGTLSLGGADLAKLDAKKLSNDIREYLKDAKKQLQDNWATNLVSYVESFKKQYDIKTALTEKQLEQAEDTYLQLNLDQAFRMALLRGQLNQQVGMWGGHSDSELDLASSIIGTGTFNMSSRAAREGSKMLAIEAIALAAGAVTVGMGTFAVNAIAASVQARKIARIARATVKWANNFVGRSIAQGAVFEIGHGGAKSLIEGENMYSMRGFGDSVLFAGVLGGVSKMLAGSSKLAQWSQTGNGLVQFSKGAIVDGAALNVAGVTSKLAFDDKFSYSPEELAQAFVMAGLFRGAGKAAGAVASKFKVSRDADGGLRVEPQLPPPGSMPVPVNTQAATTAYAPVQNQPINSVPGSRKQSSPDIVVKDKDGTVLQTTAESASLRKPFEVTTSKTEGNKIQNQSPSTGEYAQKPTGVNNYTPATDVWAYQQLYTHLAPNGTNFVKSKPSIESPTALVAESAPTTAKTEVTGTQEVAPTQRTLQTRYEDSNSIFVGETYPNGAPKNGVRYQKNADGTVNHGTQQRGTFDESGAFVSGNHRVEFADGVSTTSARRVDPVTGQSVDVAINSRNEFGVRRTVLQDGTYVARPKGEVKSSSVPATEAQSVVSTTPQNTTTVSPSTSNTSDLLKNRVNKLAGVQREPHNGQLMTETEAFVQNSAKRNPNVGEAYTAALQFKASKLNTYYDEIEKQFAPSETKVRGKNIFVQLGEDFMVGRTDITNFSLTNLKSGQKYEGLKSREEVKDIITQRYTHPEAARINAAEKAVLAGDMSRLAELAKLEGRRLEDYAVVNGRITRI